MADIPINITVSRPNGGGEVKWTTSVMRDDSMDQINEVSDKLMQAMSRQAIWGRVEQLHDDIAVQIGQKAAVMFNIRKFERLGSERASSVERQGYQQNCDTLIRLDAMIEIYEDQQKKLLQSLNGANPPCHDGTD